MAAALRWVALFSGQGGQRLEHAHALADDLRPPLREAWATALLGAGVAANALDETALSRNRVAQPTLCAWQVHAWQRIAASLPPPVLVAGYSVGELAACSAAGGYAGSAAIALAARRACAMDEATQGPSGLAAVLGLAADDVAALCAQENVAVAIRNGPRHFIVGGADAALACFIAAAVRRGAVRAQRLCVNTPAHTPMLAEAVLRFAAALASVMEAERLRIPMLTGVDGGTLRTTAQAADALARQIATPLDWSACMDAVAEMRPDAVLEIGPGDALARMFAEAVPGVPVRALDAFRAPASAAEWVSRQRN
jgi:[acyl-carrier-protein] S-malonyltransferase